MQDLKKYKILIIDDEKMICSACSQVFCREGYVVETCFNGTSGLAKFDEFNPDIVFVDLKMSGMSGADVLKQIKQKNENVVSIVITGYATIESAVESMKNGAFDFLPKPFTPEELRIITRRALEKRRVSLETERLKQEKERMRKNFTSLVSHELKTPLVAVMQYLEVLLTCDSTYGVSPEQCMIINRMKIRLRELLAIIDRWLKLTRIDGLQLKEDFEDFPLTVVIRESADLVASLAIEKKVRILIKPSTHNIVVNGDREMIKEIFTNLVHNGIKYNHEGGSVTIGIRHEKNFWIVDVSDTGVGIEEKDIAHIGEEFYRVKREESTVGSGLGLAITKKILNIHGGRLEIRSTLNKGSTFSVYLPQITTEAKQDS
jgi:two-component system sensor histidine kinase/response regulator